jgi:hypothetical protein
MTSRRSLAWMATSVFVLSCTITSVRAAEKVDPSGTWTWIRELEGSEGQSVLTLNCKDGKLTGLYKRSGQAVPIVDAKVDGNEISFEADGKWNELKIRGKFKGKVSHNAKRGCDEIHGSIDIVVEDGSLPLPWVARRGVDADNLVGTWTLKFVTADGTTVEPHLKLTIDGGVLKGTYVSSRFGELEAKQIRLNGTELSWTVESERDGQTFKGVYKARLDAAPTKGEIKGTLALDAAGNSTSLEFSGERTTPRTAAVSKEDGAKNNSEKPKTVPKPADGKSTQTSPTRRRVIVMLKSRHETLVVYSSAGNGQGPGFAIRSAEGKEVAKNLSLKDLQASYPQIYEQYRTSFANLSADVTLTPPIDNSAISPSQKLLKSAIIYRGVDFPAE